MTYKIIEKGIVFGGLFIDDIKMGEIYLVQTPEQEYHAVFVNNKIYASKPVKTLDKARKLAECSAITRYFYLNKRRAYKLGLDTLIKGKR